MTLFICSIQLRILYIMAGRKQDSNWTHSDRFVVPGISGWRAKCKLCQKEMQGVVNRLRQHCAFCSSRTQHHSLETIQLSKENSQNNLSGEAPIAFVAIPRKISSKRKGCHAIDDYTVKPQN